MARVFQTAVGFTKITTNQRRISTSTLDCSSVQIYLIFLCHRCQIQKTVAGNGIVLTLNEAVTTTLFPAPEKIIYCTVCNCKTICVSLRCKSAKSDLDCIELCQRDGCQNDTKDEFFKVAD